jgi:hypothetical protein
MAPPSTAHQAVFHADNACTPCTCRWWKSTWSVPESRAQASQTDAQRWSYPRDCHHRVVGTRHRCSLLRFSRGGGGGGGMLPPPPPPCTRRPVLRRPPLDRD